MPMTIVNNVIHMTCLLLRQRERGSLAKETRQVRPGSQKNRFRRRAGLKPANRPVICVNRVPGTLNKFDVASAAAQYARRAVCRRQRPYSNLRMRRGVSRCTGVNQAPVPADAPSPDFHRPADTCRDAAQDRTFRCALAPTSPARNDRANCDRLQPIFGQASP